jgi:hypothetical protein
MFSNIRESMDNRGFIETSLPIIGILIIAIIVIGSSVALVTINKPSTPPTPTIAPNTQLLPTQTKNGQMQITTFYFDEYNQPLTTESLKTAIARNEARVNVTVDLIDSDINLVDQLNKSF